MCGGFFLKFSNTNVNSEDRTTLTHNDTQIYVVFNIKFNKMEEDKNLEQNLDKSNEKLHISDVIVSCPKCNSSWIGDIGYGNCECWMCGNVFKLKSKTGLEDN